MSSKSAIIALVVLAITLAGGMSCMAAYKVADFYVSPEGNDAWSGIGPIPTLDETDGPFATIGRAQAAAREVSSAGKGVTVAIRGGTYQLTEPIIFTPEDSGREQGPVVYTALLDETPILSGGRKVTGWEQGEGGLWIVEIPDVKAGEWYFADLYVNGERRFRPRLPREGFFEIAELISPDVKDAFIYNPGDIKPMYNQDDVEVVNFNAWDEQRFRIKSLDEKKNIVTFTGSNNWEWKRWGSRYYLENVREALDEPGEWYLDRKTGILYYYPMPEEQMENVEVIAPVLEELIRFQGDAESGKYVEHITLSKISLQYTGWTLPPEGYVSIQAAFKVPGVIVMNDTRNCRITDCELTRIAKYGIELARGCRDNVITRNTIHDMGAGGIKIGETGIRANEAVRTGGNTITHNHIHDGGKTYLCAVGIWIGHSGDNIVSHNHIHDLYYTGISVGWRWGYGESLATANKIEYNHIHNLGKGLLSDMGGIYTLGISTGTVIRHNLIHDVVSYAYGGWGIYPDEGSTDILIENNIVYRTKTGGFHQHYGKENIVRNNIFAFAKEGQIQRTRPEEHISFTFERNIIYWTDGPLLHGNWRDDMYRFDHNLYWNTSGTVDQFYTWSRDEWIERGFDVNSVIADPLFIDPENGDFRLQPDSPAFKLGFERIDMTGVPGI